MLKILYIDSEETIAYAANELKRILMQMDNCLEIAICSMEQYGSQTGYWLGTFDSLSVVGPDVDNPELDDAYVINIVGTTGIIAGSNARSVLLAVYRYLRELGCAWIRPGIYGEIIPQKKIDNQQIHIREAASYRHRGVCIEGAVNYDHIVNMMEWLPKIGMNAYFNQFSSPFNFYDKWYKHDVFDLSMFRFVLEESLRHE